jgi:methionine synthase II (cobalamin-independent)
MRLSTERILTTHVGSLPRPDDLREILEAKERGAEVGGGEFEAKCSTAVNDAIAKQRDCGMDVLSDGEMSKVSYVGYVKERLHGIEQVSSSYLPEAISSVFPSTTVYRISPRIRITPNTGPSKRSTRIECRSARLRYPTKVPLHFWLISRA